MAEKDLDIMCASIGSGIGDLLREFNALVDACEEDGHGDCSAKTYCNLCLATDRAKKILNRGQKENHNE